MRETQELDDGGTDEENKVDKKSRYGVLYGKA